MCLVVEKLTNSLSLIPHRSGLSTYRSSSKTTSNLQNPMRLQQPSLRLTEKGKRKSSRWKEGMEKDNKEKSKSVVVGTKAKCLAL